ncbi:MAG: GTP pyrophosphokinase family protein [Clostridia bacterium]|nr:GTP pyrophosphokinase family protein [Clostridia bacterium]
MKETNPKALSSALFESGKELRERIRAHQYPFRELMAYYRCAMMEVETKFRVLSETYSLEYDQNPIESIKTRLKSVDSIADKLLRSGLPIDVEAIETHLNDVAGVRIVCGFPSDIYRLAEAFLNQDDVTLLARKDYMSGPKENGYRSLHLIVEIPIFLHDKKKRMKVEVQLRTISMDWWASLEHKIRYKKDVTVPEEVALELRRCAEAAEALDKRMEWLRDQIRDATKES